MRRGGGGGVLGCVEVEAATTASEFLYSERVSTLAPVQFFFLLIIAANWARWA